MSIALPAFFQKITQRYVGNLLEHDWLDFAVSHVDPLWSLDRLKAQVVSIHAETPDIRRIVMRPNQHWTGFQPGQFVSVRVPVNGVYCERCYSLTSDPAEGLIEIAVKKQPGGKVSTWLHESLQVGDVLDLGAVGGEFVLPQQLDRPALMIAGGSGITPIYSLTRALLQRAPDHDVLVMYYVNRAEDLAFANALQQLTAAHPGLRLVYALADQGGRFSEAQLQSVCPDWESRQAFLCGPQGLMDAVGAVWLQHGRSEQLLLERFGAAVQVSDASANGMPVTLRRSQLQLTHTANTLLESAEAAGARPAYGCRMGMCKQCTCTKVSGVVRDRITGAIDDNPNTAIRLCITEPLSPVELDI